MKIYLYILSVNILFITVAILAQAESQLSAVHNLCAMTRFLYNLFLCMVAGHMCRNHIARLVAMVRVWLLKHTTKKAILASPSVKDYRLEHALLAASKASILTDGLPGTISVEWLPGKRSTGALLALVITPLPGFIHLVKDEYVAYLTETHGEYHISIVFEQDICTTKFTNEQNARIRAAVQAIFARWNGVRGNIPINNISKNCTAAIGGDIPRDMNLLYLHRIGQYNGRQLHISM